ncbi:MAG: hypothetical protein ACREOZ_04130 [Gloeomargaritales cyanobacterium]
MPQHGQRPSERFASGAVEPTVGGSGSVANHPRAPREKEDRRLVPQNWWSGQSAHQEVVSQRERTEKSTARIPRSPVVDGWSSPRFPGTSPAANMGDKRTDDQHRVPAVTRCAPAAVLAHTRSVPLDNARCHRVAERNPLRQILWCTRDAPTVQAHRTPGYCQTKGESHQRKASGQEKDRSQTPIPARIGEPNPWEEDHPREEAH